MEPTEEVLVVIQAESGEEIALPLTALDEQHQEVVLDPDGTTQIEGDASTVPSPERPIQNPVVPRVKQPRKRKLVYLPLFDEDPELRFQNTEHHGSPNTEEAKRKPRKEYRTKRRLAEIQDRREDDVKPVPKKDKKDHLEEIDQQPPPQEQQEHEQQHQQKQEQELPQPQAPTPVAQPTPERRTRLSNTCRVATDKMYRCNNCDYSTERINNIIMHMKETCPKIKKSKVVV